MLMLSVMHIVRFVPLVHAQKFVKQSKERSQALIFIKEKYEFLPGGGAVALHIS